MQKLKERYEQYIREAGLARRKAGLCDGLFGMGNDPRKHPCHDGFYEAVGRWTADFLEANPGEEQCREAVTWILEAAHLHRDQQDVYWYMYAAQAHALPLIPFLGAETGKILVSWYDHAYPARDRMPVQDLVYKALKKTSRPKRW